MSNRLKILHVIPNLCKGGAERLVIDICSELGNRPNIDVQLITFSDLNLYPRDTPKVNNTVINVGVQLSILKKDKIDVSALQLAIDSFAPDIIHTHLFYAELVTRLCVYPKAQWFSHCHDNMIQLLKPQLGLKEAKNKIVRRYERKKLFQGYHKNGGTTFLAISKDCEKYFSENGRPYPVQLFPNAINYKQFFQKITADSNSKLSPFISK